MRRACRTASEILERVSELVRPGMTTKEVDEAAADFMHEAGVKSAFLGYRLGHRVFPGNICISLNDEIVHGIGSLRRIQYGDIVKLDIGVIQDGWVGDTATTVAVGMIEERMEELLRVTESALARARSPRRMKGARSVISVPTIEEEAVRNGFSRRARVRGPRRRTKAARGATDSELRKARQRAALESGDDSGD